MTEKNILLGGQSWPVAPIVLGEQETVVPLIQNIQKEARLNGVSKEWFGLMRELLLFIIKRTEVSFTAEQYKALPATQKDLLAAFRTIAEQAGMEFNPPGEAKGASSPQPTGTN